MEEGKEISLSELLPEDLRSDPKLSTFKDVGTLAKSYLEAQKLIGDKRYIIPKDDDVEGWEQLYNKLGRPEKPDEYEISLPKDLEAEADGEMLKEFRATAHKLGLNKKQAAELFNWYTQLVGQKQGEIGKVLEEQKKKTEEMLRQEWGRAFEANLNKAKGALRKFVPQEEMDNVIAELDKTGLGNSPHLIKVFHRIAESMSEDGLVKGEPDTKSYYQQAIEITRSQAYIDGNHPEHKQAIERARELFKKAFPE